MMMLGTNNLEIADVILNWVDENVISKNKKISKEVTARSARR